MKIIKNENLIRRNGRIGQWASIAGLLILGGGMYISFQRPELFGYSMAALLAGFTLTQVSMYFGSRFGRSPRPDERLDSGLKGLPGEYSIYHFTGPVPHLMVGPAGLWVLLPYHQGGTVIYRNNRWRLRGGGFFQNYLRIFGQEGLGRPDLDAANGIAAVGKHLRDKLGSQPAPDVSAVLVFTNENVDLEPDQTPVPALRLRQLKDFMRQKARERPVSAAAVAGVQALL